MIFIKAVGIIVEYNPFHNGHLHHIDEVKKKFKDYIIIAVMSGNFTQRGDVSIINKFDKASCAILNGVDIVVELPFIFCTQSADYFSKYSIELLNHLGVSDIVFGSESNDIEILKASAIEQLTNAYDEKAKEILKTGVNYPTALSISLNRNINTPNDILGVCYIKEVIKNNYNINMHCIKRTNDYHSITNEVIASATSIRNAIVNKDEFKHMIPNNTHDFFNNNFMFRNKLFKLLKYKINTSNDLSIYATVDEGLPSRIKKMINISSSYDEFIKNVKTKRYTYNKINRMCIHILCSLTKEEVSNYNKNTYIRILKFNNIGKSYLNHKKKDLNIPLITTISRVKDPIIDIEIRSSYVYASILDDNLFNEFLLKEYNNVPYIN